jgi:RNAse (barnase) inhibitor barstar
VVMRFVRVPVEISMVNASCLRSMLRTYLDKSIDLCQKNHEMRETG